MTRGSQELCEDEVGMKYEDDPPYYVELLVNNRKS